MPFRRTSRAVKFPAAAPKSASTDQYSCGLNASISSSRSQIEAQRHRLHAARRTRTGQLPPQHRREREADEIVERTAREIGVDQLLVDLARMRHRIEHGGFGDRVEDDALDLGLAERLPLAQSLQHVPGDRLTLAVGVGCENQPVGAFDGVGDVLQTLLRPGIHLPDHLEVVIGVDRPVLGGQVADMAVARQDFEIPAQILIDRLGLGRRFDNDNACQVRPLVRGVKGLCGRELNLGCDSRASGRGALREGLEPVNAAVTQPK